MLINDSLKEYIGKVASASPTPGGGSVSAAAASLGIALSTMVYNLTIGRKFYEEYTEDIKEEIQEGLNICNRLLNEYIRLIDEDTAAYDEVMKALKMPKTTEEEKKARSEALQKAYVNAMNVPLKLARLCGEGFTPTMLIAEYGNPNAVSDAAVGAILLYAAIEGAVLNVKVNLPYIKAQEIVEKATKECDEILNKYKESRDEVVNKVLSKISGKW
ncbi:MAG TPA: cyclodeaminase/cyclohydrolase family protein [Clostridia bacterium]|nr:cyclodeaminase/cyclohydrolase family protein [Clostridia bacterium]